MTVQVGQCGNQLGFDFFAALARESGREVEDESALRPQPLHQHISTLFRETPRSRGRDGGRSCCSTARAVLLDAEPRVIANVAARAAPSAPLSQQWQYTGLLAGTLFSSACCCLLLKHITALFPWVPSAPMMGFDGRHRTSAVKAHQKADARTPRPNGIFTFLRTA